MILILVPAGIRLIVKPPPLGAIVPAVAVILDASDAITTVYVNKLGAHVTVDTVNVGGTLAVMVKLTGVPGHVPICGVTAIVEI